MGKRKKKEKKREIDWDKILPPRVKGMTRTGEASLVEELNEQMKRNAPRHFPCRLPKEKI